MTNTLTAAERCFTGTKQTAAEETRSRFPPRVGKSTETDEQDWAFAAARNGAEQGNDGGERGRKEEGERTEEAESEGKTGKRTRAGGGARVAAALGRRR